MMRERKFATSLALRLADHAMRHCAENCQIFVEKLGLPALFSMFMRKGPKEKSKAKLRETEEHVTSIVQSLTRYCTGTAVARVLNKFTESSFAMLDSSRCSRLTLLSCVWRTWAIAKFQTRLQR